MKSKQAKFILIIAAVIIVVIGLGFLTNKAQGPGTYDEFAKALKAGGAEFYGAFWCPHCQAQKEEFGTSKKYLPYIECSNPNQSMTQVCKDKKIESYPTWMFRDGITLKSTVPPTVCDIKPGKAGEDAVCANASSQYYKTWVFPGYKFSIKSPSDPIVENGVWKFPQGSETTGELPLQFLAEQIGFTLPADTE